MSSKSAKQLCSSLILLSSLAACSQENQKNFSTSAGSPDPPLDAKTEPTPASLPAMQNPFSDPDSDRETPSSDQTASTEEQTKSTPARLLVLQTPLRNTPGSARKIIEQRETSPFRTGTQAKSPPRTLPASSPTVQSPVRNQTETPDPPLDVQTEPTPASSPRTSVRGSPATQNLFSDSDEETQSSDQTASTEEQAESSPGRQTPLINTPASLPTSQTPCKNPVERATLRRRNSGGDSSLGHVRTFLTDNGTPSKNTKLQIEPTTNSSWSHWIPRLPKTLFSKKVPHEALFEVAAETPVSIAEYPYSENFSTLKNTFVKLGSLNNRDHILASNHTLAMKIKKSVRKQVQVWTDIKSEAPEKNWIYTLRYATPSESNPKEFTQAGLNSRFLKLGDLLFSQLKGTDVCYHSKTKTYQIILIDNVIITPEGKENGVRISKDIIAMAMPSLHKLADSGSEKLRQKLLLNFFTAFSAAKQQVRNNYNRNITIHIDTEGWNSDGDFQDLSMMIALQILAARLADIKLMVYFPFNDTIEKAFDSVLNLSSETDKWFSDPQTENIGYLLYLRRLGTQVY